MPANDENVDSRAMAVRLLVCADFPLRYVGLDGVVHHAKHRAFGSAAAIESTGKSLAGPYIRDKIRRPLLGRIALFKVALLTAESIAKDERVFEDKFRVVKSVDDSRSAGHGDVPGGFFPRSIEMLVPGVHGNTKITAFLPLESFLLVR